MWKCGSQDPLYSGNYRNKEKRTILFRHSFLFSLVTLLQLRHFWCVRPITALCLLFVFSPSCRPFPTCLPPLLLLCSVSSQYTIKTFAPLFFFFFQLSVLFSTPCLDASTGPPTAAVVSAVSVLCPAGVGGWLAFVAVEESGCDDQNSPHEEHTVDDSRQHRQLEKLGL